MALVVATPHPDLDIHALFSHYDSTYFDCTLSSSCVEWSSPRLTSCTATCTYFKAFCRITLSRPLLMYLSADHVKNTLLHEMIHAHLFVTKKIRSHGTHGPEFREFMNLINSSTITDDQRPSFGYKITLFHDFHDEDVVDDNIAHCWMCQKCGDTTKRATPSQPSHADCVVQAHHAKKTCSYADCHWHRHRVKCDGTYMKMQNLEEHHDKKKAVLKGSARLHGSESLEKLIPEKTGKSIMTYSKRTVKLLPSSDKSNLRATSQEKTGKPIMTYSKRTIKLLPSTDKVNSNATSHGSSRLIKRKSSEGNVSDKRGKSITEHNKEITMFFPSAANSHKISQPRTRRNMVSPGEQEHSPNTEESSQRSKLGVRIDQKPDLQDLSSPNTKKSREGNRSVKGKSPQLRTIKEEITSSQPAHTSPYPSKAVLEEKPQQFTCNKRNSSHPEMEKAKEKPKASEKTVESEVQTHGDITRSLPSRGNSRAGSSSGKVVQHRKSELSSSNMVALSRKRRLTRKESNFQEHKVVSKWLDYYEDESTDEEIEPLVNIRTVRNKRMKILRESIKREKEENERKLKDEMEVKLLCLPGFSQDRVLEISDDDIC
ncbi:hypothetical protein LUZ61_009511 [Rhynchospora tenuis]|uniref:SprT-like domain-containing protein n=1 Tax=Rhynchospora tenuis TaxID=198213 RepID=A0AAD6EYE0_9POAL|nr:hypothetical protein LUZ61_009511 [Rhynchospora tenuis]